MSNKSFCFTGQHLLEDLRNCWLVKALDKRHINYDIIATNTGYEFSVWTPYSEHYKTQDLELYHRFGKKYATKVKLDKFFEIEGVYDAGGITLVDFEAYKESINRHTRKTFEHYMKEVYHVDVSKVLIAEEFDMGELSALKKKYKGLIN